MSKNIYCCLLFVVFAIGDVNAQTTGEESLRQDLNSIFQGLNKYRVPTGLLLDYAIEYTDIRVYNGKDMSDSTIVDRHIFTNILRTLQSSVVNDQTYSIPSDIWEDIENPITTDGKVTLFTTLFEYNSIKDNALQDNLVSYRNGVVGDNYRDGVWVNPYNQSYAFAFAPSSEICTSSNVLYTILAPEHLRNSDFIKLQFDADDGLGYRAINQLSTTNNIRVTYSSDGLKTLRLKAFLQDGEILETHCQIFLASEYNATINGTNETEAHFIMREFTSVDGGVSANVAIKLASGNGLVKPFIIVEGFDPSGIDFLNNNDKFGSTSCFTQDVSVVKNLNFEESIVVSDYDMMLLNSDYQIVQHIPFAVLYKPVFPEPLTPATQL